MNDPHAIAAQTLRDAQALHDKVLDRLDAARAAVPEPADLQALQTALEDCASDHALGLGSAATVTAARKALSEAPAHADARATALGLVNGLQRRLQAAQTALMAARAEHEHLSARQHEKPGAFAALVQRMRA